MLGHRLAQDLNVEAHCSRVKSSCSVFRLSCEVQDNSPRLIFVVILHLPHEAEQEPLMGRYVYVWAWSGTWELPSSELHLDSF